MNCGLRDLWRGTSAEVFYAPGLALPLSKGSLLCLKSSNFPTEELLSVWTVSFYKASKESLPSLLEAPFVHRFSVEMGAPVGAAADAPLSTSPLFLLELK